MTALAELSPESTMQQVLDVYPGARRALFRRHHIGGCASCSFQPEETLRELCSRNGSLNVEQVLEELAECQAEDERMTISPENLAEALRTSEARLLDIRTREEFEAVRLPQAEHFTQERMQEILNKWPKDQLLVILDHKGTRCLDAAAWFAGHGFLNVKGLRGGIDAWSEQIDASIPRYTLER